MFDTVTTRIARTSYPRLTAISLLGFVLTVIGGVLWLTRPAEPPPTTPVWFQALVLGYILLLVGVSGYIAITVFQKRPGP